MVCIKIHIVCLFIDLPVNIVVGNKPLKCEAVLFSFLCSDKNTGQNQPRGGKGLLYLTGYSSSQREVREEVELKQNLRNASYWLACYPAGSSCFCIQSRTTTCRGLSLPHQSLLKKIPTGQSWRHFLN